MLDAMDDYVIDFDALSVNAVFCIWLGASQMSSQRAAALQSIVQNIDSPIIHITDRNVRQWQRSGYPFHPGFEFLSETHRADYLRCYLMHHFGGGYTDIKHTTSSWRTPFREFRFSRAFGMGYREVGPQGVAPVGGELGSVLRMHFAQLIGCCSFIFRRNTEFTTEWMRRVHETLDTKLDALRRNPARHPQDATGMRLDGASPSPYPFAWTEILGNIFHPLVYEWNERIMHASIAPSFVGYR